MTRELGAWPTEEAFERARRSLGVLLHPVHEPPPPPGPVMSPNRYRCLRCECERAETWVPSPFRHADRRLTRAWLCGPCGEALEDLTFDERATLAARARRPRARVEEAP